METITARRSIGVRMYASTEPAPARTRSSIGMAADRGCRETAALLCARDEEERADRRFAAWLRRRGRAAA